MEEASGTLSHPAPIEPRIPSEDDSSALPENEPPLAVLMPFDATGRFAPAIPFAFADYLDLVDTLGRAVHPRKRGFIPEHTPAILARLGVDAETFMREAARLLKSFGSAVVCPARLAGHAAARNVRFLRGVRSARAMFEPRMAA